MESEDPIPPAPPIPVPLNAKANSFGTMFSSEEAERKRMVEVVADRVVSELDLASFRGEVVTYMDGKAYEEARRVWNRGIDVRPAVVARVRGPSDVREVLRAARAAGDVPVAVRGGGHNVAGLGLVEAGVVVDLSLMRGVRVDPAKREAVVQGGALWQDLDAEAALHGLATPGGLISSTGVAGLALLGGIGFLSRAFGLAVDQIVAADVVLADGTHLVDVGRGVPPPPAALADQEPEVVPLSRARERLKEAASDAEARAERAVAEGCPDARLFWALRGAGPNFGVVTSLTLRLHPMPSPPLLFTARFTGDYKARLALRLYAELAERVMERPELTAYLFLTQPAAALVYVVGVGDAGAAGVHTAVQPLVAAGPAQASLAPVPYTALQSMHDRANGPGEYKWGRSTFLDSLGSNTRRIIASSWRAAPEGSTIEIMQLGGLTRREGTTPLPWRASTRYETHPIVKRGPLDDDDEWARRTEWCDITSERLAFDPARVGTYLNFDSEDQEQTASHYGPYHTYLQTLKQKYDPSNVFHRNHNIKI